MGPYVSQLLKLIHHYGLDDRDDKFKRLRRLCEWGEISEDMAEVQIHALQEEFDEAERKPNYLHRTPEFEELHTNRAPDVVLGKLVEKEEVPFGMSFDEPFHAEFVGTTHSGKTVGMRRLVTMIEQANRDRDRPISVIVLDRKGYDYGDIRSKYPERWLHFDIHGDLRLGLNGTEGMPSNIWCSQLATILCARAGLKLAWVPLAHLIRWLLAVMNPDGGDDLNWPDWKLVLDVASKLPEKSILGKGEYIRSLRTVLSALTESLGNLFGTFNGLDLERDIINQGKSVVISMPVVSPPWIRQFITDLLIYQVLIGRMHVGHRVDSCEVIFVIDEADADVSQDAERMFPDGFSPISQVLRMGREFGIGVCIGIASLGPVSRHVLNSAAYHFVFRLRYGVCCAEASRTLSLPPRGHEIIPALDNGECLVRQPGRWSHAMLGKFDFVAPNRSGPPVFDSHGFVPSRRLDEMPDVLAAVKSRSTEHGRGVARQEQKKLAKNRPEARQLLMEASLRPFAPVARLYDRMDRPPPATQKAIRSELENAGFANFKEARVGSKNLLLIELTDDTWNLLGKSPIEIRGRGGMDHRAFSNWITMVGAKRGYEAHCEYELPGTSHAVDAAWIIQDSLHVFEVVVSCTKNLHAHLKSIFIDTTSQVQEVTIVAPQKAALMKLKAQLEAYTEFAEFAMRITYETVGTFERELWP